MPKVRNLFTDYTGTLEPRYVEIPLAYELLAYHKEQGNSRRYLDLLIPLQMKMVAGFLAGDKHRLLKNYVNEVLKGEDMQTLHKAIRKVLERETKVPRIMKKLLGEKRIFGSPDPKAKELFRKAKDSGMNTGIYTTALVEFVRPALKEEGMLEYFDRIQGNEIEYDGDLKVKGLDDWNVGPGKKDLRNDLLAMEYDPKETAFIDNEDIEPLTQVGMGIACPTSKQRFKDQCKELNIYTPNSWEETAEIVGIMLD